MPPVAVRFSDLGNGETNVSVDWNDANIKTLKDLWADGWSCSQISTRIPGSTRSAIIGKIHRLGLSGRTTLHRTPHPPPRARKPRKLPKPGTHGLFPWPSVFGRAPKFASTPLPKANEADVARKTLLELDDHECRFPVGDESPQRLCALEKIPGLPYCEAHVRRCISAPPARDQIKPFRQWVLHKGGTYRMKKEFA